MWEMFKQYQTKKYIIFLPGQCWRNKTKGGYNKMIDFGPMAKSNPVSLSPAYKDNGKIQ